MDSLTPEPQSLSSASAVDDNLPSFIRQSAALGSVPDSSSESYTGAYLYQVPLKVPPGRSGMEPDLKLVYSSQSHHDDDFYGYGWDMPIPYIERINKKGLGTLYATTSPVYFSSSMSGELATTSTSTLFVARDDDGSNLSYSFSGNAWTVTDKTGKTYLFGTSTSGRQDDPGNSGRIFKWMLQQVTDSNGNTIIYSYSKDSGQIYPASISYTGSGSSTGIFSVDFAKSLRATSTATSTATGFTVKTKYKIDAITAKVSGDTVHAYTLTYRAGDNDSRLILASVTEAGQAEGSSTPIALPQTAFGYTESSKTWATTTWTQPMATGFVGDGWDKGVNVVDINGDGLADEVQAYDAWNGRNGYDVYRHVYINNGESWTLDSGWTPPCTFTYLESNNYLFDGGGRLADVNGDLLPDFICDTNVYLNTGSNWSASAWSLPLSIRFEGLYDNGVRFGDIDGDGLIDVLRSFANINAFTGATTYSQSIYLNTGAGWTTAVGWAFPTTTILFGNSNHNGNSRGQVADINGDNLADLTQEGSVYINTGSGWSSDPAWSLPGDIGGQSARLVDINGDSLPDVVSSEAQVGPYPTPPVVHWLGNSVYLNTGIGFIQDHSRWAPVALRHSGQEGGVRFADLNGDGIADFVAYGWGQPHFYSWEQDSQFISQGQEPDLLSRVINQTGGTISVAYKGSAQYRDDSDELLNPSLPATLTTLEKVEISDGLSATSTDTFEYADGDFYFDNPFDRRIAGFGSITKTDAVGDTVVTRYHQGNASESSLGEYSDDRSKIGKVFRTDVSDSSGDLFKSNINKWETHDRGGEARFVKTTQALEQEYDGDSDHKDKAVSYAYNNTNGNLVQKIDWGEVTGSGDGTFSDTGSDLASTTISYAASSTLVGLPSSELTHNQSGAKIKEARYYYDNQTLGSLVKGNLTKKEDWIAASAYASTTKVYGTYGLVTQERDAKSNLTAYAYDAFNLYPATTTNALSQATGYLYDYSSGQVRQIADPNGRLHVKAYDGLDRVLAVQEPDPLTGTLATTTAYAYSASSTPGSTSVEETRYLNAATTTSRYTYFDGLNRKFQERSQAEVAGTFAVRDWKYDRRGLMSSESLPYFASGSSRSSATSIGTLYTNYLYDPLQRAVGVGTAVGTTTNAYDQWKTTTTDANDKAKEYTKDARGNLISVVEYLSGTPYTTTYAWDLTGSLVSLTDAAGNVRSFAYDGLGRRTSAGDLHAPADASFGSTTYSYDAAGNLTQKIDAKGQTVQYSYDVLNRPVSENYTGQAGTEVSYVYDSCQDGVGRLCTASSTNSLVQYAYNPAGLVRAATSTLVGTTTAFATAYEYDRQGNQTLVTYPDQAQVAYFYNAAGLVDAVQKKESGEPSFAGVVTRIDYAPTGKPAVVAYANGDVSTSTYNAAALYRLSRVQAKNSSGLTLQDFNYTYDPVGNIVEISDLASSTAPKTASYDYDDLYRLAQAQYAVGPSSDWYDPNWDYRVPVAASSTKVLEDTKDVYLDLSLLPISFHTGVKANGCDIRVTKQDGTTELPIDLVSYGAGAGQLHFSTGNALSASSSAQYYVYYGNPDANCYSAGNTYGAREVYDSDTEGVWHLEENSATGGAIKDSTSGSHNGTMYSNYVASAIGTTTGKFGAAANFDGVDDTIDVPDSSNFEGASMTLEGWVYMDATPSARGENARLISKKHTASPWRSYSSYVSSPTNRLDGEWISAASSTSYAGTYAGSMATGTWYYVALRHDPASTTAEASVRANGSSANTYTADTPGTTFNSNDVLRFGADYAGGERLDGRLDEIRVHSAARSDNYLATRYNNMSSPSSFWSVGSTSTSTASGGYTQTYNYDILGNIIAKSDVGAYAYAGTGYANPHAPTSIASSTYAYDNNGNLASGGGFAYAWDYANRLASAGSGTATSTYSYDHESSRIKLVEGSKTTYFPNRLYSAMAGGAGTTTKNIYAAGMLVSTVEKSSASVGSPTASTTQTIYADTTSWDNWSWGSTQNFSNTSPTYAGSNSIAVTYTEAWGGLYLHNAGISTVGSTHLRLAFRSTSASPLLQVIGYNSGGSPANTVQLSSYVSGGTIAANTWYSIDIPLADLGIAGAMTTGFVFQKDSTGTVYYDDIRLISISGGAGGTTRYIHTDHLGSTHVVTDQSGAPVQSLAYYPFGSVQAETGTDVSQREYIGEVADELSGLNYLNARYYDGGRGQFLSQDPVFWEIGQTQDGKAALINPQLQNSYSYAGNNPILNKDPSGRFIPQVLAAGFVLGGIGGGIYQGISDLQSGQFSGFGAYGTSMSKGAVIGLATAVSPWAGAGTASTISLGENYLQNGTITPEGAVQAVADGAVTGLTAGYLKGLPQVRGVQATKVLGSTYYTGAHAQRYAQEAAFGVGIDTYYGNVQSNAGQMYQGGQSQASLFSSIRNAFAPTNSTQAKAVQNLMSAFKVKNDKK
ncbi:MAG: hypothetical protein JWL87_135 [Candidatus Adlerbacteria bacterium]|nr:hypothetical protein [Candidatus Adlerbacteria bacterium]